jgi:hypothetical protein
VEGAEGATMLFFQRGFILMAGQIHYYLLYSQYCYRFKHLSLAFRALTAGIMLASSTALEGEESMTKGPLIYPIPSPKPEPQNSKS